MARYIGNVITKSPATPTGPNPITGRAPGVWRLEDVAYWIRQGVWPNASADGYFPYVSLLLSTTSLGNANNNLFVDSSGAFNPVSRNGNTTQGSFTPYSTNWSNYFDGSGDYLTLPSNSALEISSGDFTIEAWVFKESNGNYQSIYSNWNDSNSGGVLFCMNGLTPAILWRPFNTATALATGPVVTANTWTHVAVVRSGNVFTVYTNGVAGTPVTYSTNATAAQTYQVGAYAAGASGNFNGYMSNVRVVKGTAVYTSDFSPSGIPLTAISGTSLLTCQSNRFRDASTNNFTITRNGDTRVTDFGPFNPASPGASYNQSDITNWSGYFDGSGDYLVSPSSSEFAFGTGDYTLEGWFYTAATGTERRILYFTDDRNNVDVTSSNTIIMYDGAVRTFGTPVPNAWNHFAVSRASGTVRCYLNGVLGYSGSETSNTSTRTLYVGANNAAAGPFNGYLSNIRVVKGTAVYTGASLTVPTTPLTAISGTSLLTCQNAAFTDNSTNNFILTQNGNPTVTGNSPFNTTGFWSNYFDGSGDYLTVPSNTALAFGTGDFTIEFWTYRISGANTDNFIISSASNGGFFFGTQANGWGYGSTGNFWSYNTGVIPTLNTWQHVAISRSGTSIRIFVNGSQIGTTQTDSSDWSLATGGTTIGSQGAAYYYNGYLSNIRVLKGTGLYTANFTPPTAPLTAITNTSLLTCQNGSFKDNSTNNFTLTRTGDVTVQSFDPFYTATIASNGGSMYFDGSGDFLNTATNFPPIGTGDFTAECWWYPVGTASQEFTYFSVGDVTSTSGFALATDPARGLFLYSAGYANTSGVAMPVANAWNHIVFTRQSGSLRLYLNGSLRETVSWTNSISAAQVYVGRAANGYFGTPLGYMSNIRYSGTSLYSGSTYTVPTAPLTPSANTGLLLNGMNAGIYDATTINDMETVGNAQVSTVQSKFGGSSVYFNGNTSNRVKPPASPNFAFGTGNFTVEAWVYVTNLTTENFVFDTRSSVSTAGMGFSLEPNTGKLRYSGNANNVLTSTAVSANTWTHVAWVRNGSTLTGYINGVAGGSATNTDNLTQTNGEVGNVPFSAVGTNMYIDEVRVTRGIARYTSNFTPPTQAFPTY